MAQTLRSHGPPAIGRRVEFAISTHRWSPPPGRRRQGSALSQTGRLISRCSTRRHDLSQEDPVDPQTVDQNYAQLQQQGQQTAALIQALAGKLQAAAAAGDTNAREWMLDLKEVALGVQQEEGQVSLLLQSIHSMVDNHVQSTGQPGYQQGYQQPQPGYQQQGYQPQPGYQQGYQQQGGMMGGGGGGMLQSFLGGGFGRAIVTGAGFGIGDDIINKIF